MCWIHEDRHGPTGEYVLAGKKQWQDFMTLDFTGLRAARKHTRKTERKNATLQKHLHQPREDIGGSCASNVLFCQEQQQT